MDVSNKIAIITGASSGIGLATARLLSQSGAKLALASRSKETLEMLSRELPGSIAIVADMTRVSDIKKMVDRTQEHFGRIDILINNAGQGYDAPVERTDIEIFHHILDLNVIGPLVAMQQVIPIMRKQGGGAIVNISSGTALMHIPNMSAYSASKRALVGISLTARDELQRDNIAVSIVYPYITLTNFEENTIKDSSIIDRGEEGSGQLRGDTAEYVAEKILEAIKSGQAEAFAHDWMREMAGRMHSFLPGLAISQLLFFQDGYTGIQV